LSSARETSTTTFITNNNFILMTKLNKVGEREQPLWILFLILNDSDNCPSTLTQALENEL